jgi:phosphoribosylformimino-5-aminoimidazole carboxamide ribotide isomerase
MLTRVLDAIGSRAGAVFSLDLRNALPLTNSAAWHGMDAAGIAQVAVDCGFQRMIVLDLAAVGTGQGPATGPICRHLRASHPQLEIISGGGIRDLEDVRQLARDGCDTVMVSSALHDGRISAASIHGGVVG